MRMIHPTGVWAFDEYLRQLSASIRSLDGTDGRPRARRTARQRVLKTLRRIRTVMNERAPAIIERKAAPRLKTFEGREARLRRKGYTPVVERVAAIFASVGVPIRRVVHVNAVGTTIGLYAPKWAVAIGTDNVTKLRQAKKSVVMQKAILAEKALRESVMP